MQPSVVETTDLTVAEKLWRERVPCESIFDLWEVRVAFHQQFQRPFRLLYSANPADRLFLPLSWVEEQQAWCCFPGETWQGMTWLEQNRPMLGGLERTELRTLVGAELHLRYLLPRQDNTDSLPTDETGYLFHPAHYQYRIEGWWDSFSRKRAKQIRREMERLACQGLELRHDEEGTFNRMVAMNRERFGNDSYFHEIRFREGFRAMLQALAIKGRLRSTSLYLDGRLAALDIGVLFNGRYTLLAGATSGEFPGVAKLINLHHLEYACCQRIDEVDFLCGDSGCSWKPLFHLTPRPLYLLDTRHAG